MFFGRQSRWWSSLLLLPVVVAMVDEAGRYRAGGDLFSYAPPEPSEMDRKAAVDLREQPVEKLFKLLYFELSKEERRPHEPHLSLDRFVSMAESCEEKLLEMADLSKQAGDEVRDYLLNITGTAGLYWMLHKYPEEHSWIWMISAAFQRVMRKVNTWVSITEAAVLDDRIGCFAPPVRTMLMNTLVQWKRIYSDHIALLWNAVAFGLLGDVTAWRDVDEETLDAQDGPGGPPPNVSWSENIIFSNMWVSSVQKWFAAIEQELIPTLLASLARKQRGMAEQEVSTLTTAPNGVTPTFAFLQRQLFGGWSLDKGLARGLLRSIMRPRYGDEPAETVGDFGAGGGKYSEWLNETGLVQAFAFDATYGVHDITGGRVQEADLSSSELQLWRNFSWVLCLDVLPHVLDSSVPGFLGTMRRHATTGIVMSAPPKAGDEDDARQIAKLEEALGFDFDEAASTSLRLASEQFRTPESLMVFRSKG